jgi:hypothetical protein
LVSGARIIAKGLVALTIVLPSGHRSRIASPWPTSRTSSEAVRAVRTGRSRAAACIDARARARPTMRASRASRVIAGCPLPGPSS